MDTHLTLINEKIYKPIDSPISQYKEDKESKEYGASHYRVGNHLCVHRSAKVTPKRVGQFVTFWKRSPLGHITPYEAQDPFDFFSVICAREKKVGHFLFPKTALVAQGILSTEKKDGKRGFRVYPDWDTPTSKQAIRTQLWQQLYFYRIDQNADLNRVKALLQKK